MATGNYGWNIGNDSSRQFISQESTTYSHDDQTSVEDHVPSHIIPPQPPQGHYWCDFVGNIPPGAVKAGVDKDGSEVYVGRAFHEGEMLPAKVIPQQGVAYVAWGGEEHAKSEFEILCKGGSTVVWQESSNGSVPSAAVAIGRTSDNERLFVGRVFHDGVLIPGKIHPSHGVCYVPYGGGEHSFSDYEALVLLN